MTRQLRGNECRACIFFHECEERHIWSHYGTPLRCMWFMPQKLIPLKKVQQ